MARSARLLACCRGKRRHEGAGGSLVLLTAWAALLVTAGLASGAEPSGIHDVSISTSFFNPTLGQKVQIAFSVGHSGSLTLLVLDRDGFLVRTLVLEKPAQKGELSFDWDGRDSKGEIVPDDAYSFKIDLSGRGGKSETYFPGNSRGKEFSVPVTYYDRQGAILAYKLPEPARVVILAGLAHRSGPSYEVSPVLKVLANGQPRVAGSVVEFWSGFDQGGSVYVPALPNFFVSIRAVPLPKDAVITFGNKGTTFSQSLAKRTGESLFTLSADGLRGRWGPGRLEAAVPELRLIARNAIWSSAERVWKSAAKHLELSASLAGPSAEAFARRSGRLLVFLGSELVSQVSPASASLDLDISLEKLPSGLHTVTANWVSSTGSFAVNSVRVKVAEMDSAKAAAKH